MVWCLRNVGAAIAYPFQMITRDRLAAFLTATIHPNGVQKVANAAEQYLTSQATNEKLRQYVHNLLRQYSEEGCVVRLSLGLWMGTCTILIAGVVVAPFLPAWGIAYGVITTAGLAGRLGITTGLMCNWSRAERAVAAGEVDIESEETPLFPLARRSET